MGKQWKQWQTLFWGAPKSLQMVTAAMKLKDAYSLEEKPWDPDPLRPALSLGGQATAWEGSPGRSLPPSLEFSRQEHWITLHDLLHGSLPNPGIDLRRTEGVSLSELLSGTHPALL